MRGRILVGFALSSGAIGTPSDALAQDAAASQWVVLDGWVGAGASSVVDRNSTAMAALGFAGLYHGNWLELGAGLTWQPGLEGFGTSSVIATLLAGIKVDPVPRLRLEFLAEGGVDYVSLGGDQSQTVDSGGNATLPYVGGRVGVSFPLGKTRRLVLGWWMSGGAAIGPVVVHSVVTSCNAALACTSAPQTDTFGGGIWSTGLRIGGEVGQW
jgi:hypothetical protein